MSTFGTIKTKIETTAVELAKNPLFKRFIFEFNELVLENKDISEIYYIYDDLSSNKGIPTDIANEYINESIEYSQILIEAQSQSLEDLNTWINSWNKKDINNYSDIDNSIYNTGIRNLESILESKKSIKSTIIKEQKIQEVTESVYLPISSMVKIANENLKRELGDISEIDKKELNGILMLTSDEVKKEMSELKENAIEGLKNTLTESKDGELKTTIQNTINKIMDSKEDHYNLYKLRKLNTGL
jgi:hypothetical protein